MGGARRRTNRPGRQGSSSDTSDGTPSKDTNSKKKAQNTSVGAISTALRPTSIKLLCAFTGFLLYVRSIWACYFPYDDGGGVRNNPDVLNQSNANGLGAGVMSPWNEVFRNDFWGTNINSPLTHKSYRPVVIVSFRFDAIITKWIERYVLGEAWVEQMGRDADIEHKRAWMFHVTNVLLYALVCYMVVDILLIPVAKGAFDGLASVDKPTNVLSRNQSLGILLAGLFFASHPVHTECVAQIVGRAEILAALFCLIGTKCYNLSKSSRGIFYSIGGIIGLMMSLFLACLCKETACVLPIVLVGTDIAVALLVPSNICTKDHTWNKPSFPICASMSALSVTVGYLAFRSWLFEGRQDLSPENILIYDNFVLHLSGMTKFLTALFIQAKYIQLLFWPAEISSDYSLGVIDPVYSWTDPSMVLFYGVSLGLLLVVGTALHALIHRGNTSLVQAIGWTFAPLFPASHIVTIGTPMAERLLFTPSIGIAILICHIVALAGGTPGECIASGRKTLSIRFVGLLAILVISIARFSFMTYQRVPEWADSKTVFEADIQKFPRSVKLNMALARGWWGETAEESAKSYAHSKAAQEVVDSYGDGLKETPYVIGLPMMAFQHTRNSIWPDANLGEALALANKVEERDAQRKISTDDMAFVLSARGQALLKLGLPKKEKQLLIEAETAFREAERNDGTERAPYITYCSHGLSLILLGRKEEAFDKYQICFQRKPPRDVPYADVSNYANLMGELSGFANKDASAASKWGKDAKLALDAVLSHPGLDQKPGHIQMWRTMLNWAESNL